MVEASMLDTFNGIQRNLVYETEDFKVRTRGRVDRIYIPYLRI